MGVLAQLGIEGPVALSGQAMIAGRALNDRAIVSLTRDDRLHEALRCTRALLIDTETSQRPDESGFALVVLRREAPDQSFADATVVTLPKELAYLDVGDVLRVSPDGSVGVLARRWSPHNTILLTERCNSRCLMCSQPPKLRDDSYLLDEVLEALPLIHPDTHELGITGGEPTLLGDGLVRLIQAARDHLPITRLHILSNGRLFAYRRRVEQIASLLHPELVFGIPLYADVASVHDYVVQAQGAFDQTIRGLLNLARHTVRVELRVVLQRATIPRLVELARFIARHLRFVEHVALMGLETIGFARPNAEAVWIDPYDYQRELAEATQLLHQSGMNVSVYNHQLCVTPREIWPFAVKSISDWKNVYFEECESCAARKSCGGFFASSPFRRSQHIAPIRVGL